jgi:dTDP-4-amino-4,6-dideoxygalactose transaminase
MRVDPALLGASADAFAAALVAEGVSVAAHYHGKVVYQYPLFADHSAFERGEHPFATRTYAKGLCPEAEKILETCVQLPINEAYSSQDLDETVHAITRVVQWFNATRR